MELWLTFNEPIIAAWFGYGNGYHAPGIKDPYKAAFKAGHTIIKAHAKAYQTYKNEFKDKQKGMSFWYNYAGISYRFFDLQDKSPLYKHIITWVLLTGQCGISLNCDWFQPLDPSKLADVEATEKIFSLKLGWFAEPIFGKDGDYPALLKEQLQKKSKELGLPESMLPTFTDKEKKLQKG